MTEQSLIEELKIGRTRLLDDESARVLLQAIRRRLLTVTNNLYLLSWIPEQGEDLYEVLVDGTTVAHVEIPRGANRETVFDLYSIEAYRQRTEQLTKIDRRKLEVAMRLANGS